MQHGSNRQRENKTKQIVCEECVCGDMQMICRIERVIPVDELSVKPNKKYAIV